MKLEIIFNINNLMSALQVLKKGENFRMDIISDNCFYSKETVNNQKEEKKKHICGICFKEIDAGELSKVQLFCYHWFCQDCYKDYLKEKISSSNIENIRCMNNDCSVILDDIFIKNVIKLDKELLNKYDKFYKKIKVIEKIDKIVLCPIPDCEGYIEKSSIFLLKEKNKIKNSGNNRSDKIVKCIFGHELCYNCLNIPHPDKDCEDETKVINDNFESYKKEKHIKKCPKCKLETEKNEGCNHMTCIVCKYEWCWLCEKEYKMGHYRYGDCKGLHFAQGNTIEEARKSLEIKRENYDNWFLFASEKLIDTSNNFANSFVFLCYCLYLYIKINNCFFYWLICTLLNFISIPFILLYGYLIVLIIVFILPEVILFLIIGLVIKIIKLANKKFRKEDRLDKYNSIYLEVKCI